MTLNQTQKRVLLEIGISPGNNAFSIAKKLKRDSGGINKVCGVLLQNGLISATEGKNSKNATVKELKLTLLGFALVVDILHASHFNQTDILPSSECNAKTALVLKNNQALHEGIGIFFEYYSFAPKRYGKDGPVGVGLLSQVLAQFVRGYDHITEQHLPGVMLEYLEDDISTDLYKGLFFNFWNSSWGCKQFLLDAESEYIRNIIIPKFKESNGWGVIQKELSSRESACDRLKQLRSLLKE